MLPLVLFTDAEAWAVDYLSGFLSTRPETYAAGVTVSTRVPSPRTGRMVVVRRDGGPRQTPVSEVARLGVRVWAATDEDAADLTALVRAALAASPGEGPVRAMTEISGPSYVVEESGQPLRYVVVELTMRAT